MNPLFNPVKFKRVDSYLESDEAMNRYLERMKKFSKVLSAPVIDLCIIIYLPFYFVYNVLFIYSLVNQPFDLLLFSLLSCS